MTYLATRRAIGAILNRTCGWVIPMTRRASGGRPSKGDRDSIITRPARALGDVVRTKADEAGLTISEYVAAVLAHAHDLPQYAPTPRPIRTQEELPLSRSA